MEFSRETNIILVNEIYIQQILLVLMKLRNLSDLYYFNELEWSLYLKVRNENFLNKLDLHILNEISYFELTFIV